jgi:hypothetical protein
MVPDPYGSDGGRVDTIQTWKKFAATLMPHPSCSRTTPSHSYIWQKKFFIERCCSISKIPFAWLSLFLHKADFQKETTTWKGSRPEWIDRNLYDFDLFEH